MSAVIGQVQIDTAKVLVNEVQIELIPVFRVGRNATGKPCRALESLKRQLLKRSSPFHPTLRTMSCGLYSIGANVDGYGRGLGR
ncbi:hypothetical protein DP23_3762 [Ralstonia pickettii]|nr:hypothetical protein DP23_3762 [Ralstonia pickettii]